MIAIETPQTGISQPTLARVWSDAAFKQALMTDPRPALRQIGIRVPDDIGVKTVGSKGAPSDRGDTLLQFVLERGPRFAFFFMPSPLHASAQQAAYGMTVGNSTDDPVFAARLHADAAAALRQLGAAPTAVGGPAMTAVD